MNINIQNVHMKRRCYYLFVLCLLSLHSWYIYPSFDVSHVTSYLKIDSNSYLKLYHKNCFLGLYLLWDVCNMTLSKNRKILFRKDLIIHHVTGLYFLFKYINIFPYIYTNIYSLIIKFKYPFLCINDVVITKWLHINKT